MQFLVRVEGTETRMVFARAGERKQWKLVFSGHQVSVGEGEKILETDVLMVA